MNRQTKETKVSITINLDGTGVAKVSSKIPFLDHMLDQIASHGLFDITLDAEGDTWIDDHHTNEDIGLAFGTALSQALGDRKGIYRFGDFTGEKEDWLRVACTMRLAALACRLRDVEGEGTSDAGTRRLVGHAAAGSCLFHACILQVGFPKECVDRKGGGGGLRSLFDSLPCPPCWAAECCC